MPRKKQRRTVEDLAKWKKNQVVYWLVFQSLGPYSKKQPKQNRWAFTENVHPKTIYERKLVKGIWNDEIPVPKLHAVDFLETVTLINGDFTIEPYKISQIVRCPNTGECIYSDDDGTSDQYTYWMPESCLFATKEEAMEEKKRIKGLIADWASK